MVQSNTVTVGGASKPILSYWQIWNMCFGFFGIQFAFALQNANVSRIFQTFGASIDEIAILWIAAPLTGLLVQPIIGYLSDRTWSPLGRRRPFFLFGAIAASIALFAFPHSPALWFAAIMLWVLDASINVSMEPFRALVGDMLSPLQRKQGFAMQSFFIGVGAVIASALPYVFTEMGVANTAPAGELPPSLAYAFYAGAVVLLAAVGWSVWHTREYTPAQLASFDDARPEGGHVEAAAPVLKAVWPLFLLGMGGGFAALITVMGWHKELYVLAGMAIAYGLLLIATQGGARSGMLGEVVRDLRTMPKTMKDLAFVQFFSWFGLFAMWIYTTPAVASAFFGSMDTTSKAYNDAGDWVGLMFAAYNGFAALAALVIPSIARVIGLKKAHLLNLALGGLGLISFLFIKDHHWLIASMVGVGFAWASIVSLPYALLSDSLPAHKMGVYMGIFNFFIVIPQMVAASLLGLMVSGLFNNEPLYVLAVGGASLLVSGALTLRVRLPQG